MTPDHEAAKKWAQTYDDCEDVMPNACNLAACYLDAMARRDKATELLRASVVHLEDCARDIVLRRAEEVLQARGNLALEMANRLRAFLAAERK